MNLTTKPKGIRPGKFKAELEQMAAGLAAQTAPLVGLIINGVDVGPTAAATLQGWIATFNAVDQAKGVYQNALNARLAITVEARRFYKTLKSLVRACFNGQAAELATFGIAPDKAIEITSQQRILAVAKRQQTRKLRGTKGKKQLAAITVVGQPALHIASDGSLQISTPPVNLPPASGTGPAGSNGGNTPTGA
jgi:hypothetical protein